MKRIFAIMAAVALCFALTVPAFAANYGGVNLPDIESVRSKPENSMYSHAFIEDCGWGAYALWLVNDVGYEHSSASVVVKGKHRVYYFMEDDLEFVWETNRVFDDSDSVVKFPSSSVIWSNSPIPELRDETTSPDSVLGTVAGAYETSDFVLGAMGQVLSLVALVIPVVAGLFGIRKGIAFLISRIRGV